MITYEDFLKVDIRVGTVIHVDEFKEAKKPAWKLLIDFGKDIGNKKSSAQIKHHYDAKNLIGKQVIAVVNFPPKQIGPFFSEVLVLGLADGENHIVLVEPNLAVPNGQRLS